MASTKNNPNAEEPRHIMNISGGKDSSALAIYMRDRDYWRERLGKPIEKPAEKIEFEYVFCDTRQELTETYEYLDKLEAYLGNKIIRVADERGFDHWLEIHGNFLPSPRMRWCTIQLKIKPFERFLKSKNRKMNKQKVVQSLIKKKISLSIRSDFQHHLNLIKETMVKLL